MKQSGLWEVKKPTEEERECACDAAGVGFCYKTGMYKSSTVIADIKRRNIVIWGLILWSFCASKLTF